MSRSATSFKSCIWWDSSTCVILLTLVSAFAYFAFMPVKRSEALRNFPKKPFSSSSSKLFNSVTRLDSMEPISPRSLVRTFSSAFSEKSAIFFCAPAPNCKIIWELLRSIFSAKSSTICLSCGVRELSSKTGFCNSSGTSASAFSGGCGSSANGSNVRVGVASRSFNKSSVIVLPP